MLAAYAVILATGLPANLLALRAFVGRLRRPRPAPAHVLLLSLTLADLLLLLLPPPVRMAEAARGFAWPPPRALCAPAAFAQYSGVYRSTGLLAALSAERYPGVAFPVRYQLARRPLHGLLAALLPVRLELGLALFLLPLAVTAFCYWRLVRLLRGQAHAGPRRRRAAGPAAVSLLSFPLCFGPYNASHAAGFYLRASPPWRAHALVFAALNAGLDPLLFYFSSSAVRRTFWKGVTRCRRRSAAALWGCRAKEMAEAAGGSPGPGHAAGAKQGSESPPG
ncbi:free fatty acid receptor 2 [Perognathus longimembris pacificus]|uniref:free fatty acid receptor 2 n=1 Tax=Perognathus longimembris pacificus TaxID=214514 RepID=UPI002019B999|nr:free fatty acid receptor 2 [Perognathus longimembris pacificus]